VTAIDPARPWTIITGDCRDAMRAMEPESVDAVVTDTPYGLSTLLDPPNLNREALWQKLIAGLKEAPIRVLMRSWLDTGENPVMKGRGFMGKEWDALVPPPNTWREAWRVLKPGAYLFAFGGARTYDLIKVAIRFADFEADDDICTWVQSQGMPKRVRLDLKIDQHFGKAGERPVLATVQKMQSYGSDAKGPVNGVYKGGPDKGGMQDITGAATPEAARFVGWDRALKPAYEPIIVAQKPCRGTIAENALRYGTGGMHVDACRVERGDAGEKVGTKGATTRMAGGVYAGHGNGHLQDVVIDARGGYPTNVILCERAAEVLDAMTAGRRFGGSAPASGPTFDGPNDSVAHGRRNGMNGRPAAFHGEVDGPSRFFYVAKASTAERDKGLDAMPVLTPGERSDREDGTAGINGYAGTRGEARNIGPCVKPVALMQDLVRQAILAYVTRLASPPGAHDPDVSKRPVVLDIFAGTGSTGVACMIEGVRFIGCEKDEQYANIARSRLQHAYMMPRDEDEPVVISSTTGQVSLF
jgi:site-specific DNA-methyltransferase (adenine-specific)